MPGKNGNPNPTTVALDLSADTERPLVKLPDGELYEMRVPGDFSIVEQTNLQRIWKRIQRITDGEGDLSEDEENVLASGYGRLIGMLLPDAPADIRDAMSNTQKNKLMEYFGRLARAEREQTPTDGAPPSPSSSASTEAAGKTG